jgi:hypothetical protein
MRSTRAKDGIAPYIVQQRPCTIKARSPRSSGAGQPRSSGVRQALPPSPILIVTNVTFAAKATELVADDPFLAAGALSAVDMQDLAGDEGCAFEIKHRIDDIAQLTHPCDRMQLGQEFVRLRPMHRRLNHAG